MITRLNHIAIAVPDIAKATEIYSRSLGLESSIVKELPEHGVRVAFLQLQNCTLELLEPMGENSPIQKYLNNNPRGGMHHFCLESNDLHLDLKQIQDCNIRSLGPIKNGAHGLPVVFLHPHDFCGVLIELEATRSGKSQ